MEIHLLDVGKTKYGDCIVIERGDRRILIDGSHQGDKELILSQFKKIFGESDSYHFDLLIVTHCHIDHIAELPKLVADGTITADLALVADEKLGFGRTENGDGPADDLNDNRQKDLVMLMQEEDYSSLPDEELLAFIDSALTLEEKYIAMLKKLKEDGCKIIRYGAHTKAQVKNIETQFSDFGLKILGPTNEHLVLCARTIAGSSDAIGPDILSSVSDALPGEQLAQAYRRARAIINEDAAGFEDTNDPSAAKNNQSIVIKVQADGLTALLAGDMQFADSQVDDLDGPMAALLQKVEAAGPYDFIKLTHHTALNGMNDDVWNAFSTTKNFAHTGGKNDSTHPNKTVLKLLKANSSDIKFARNDRNGMITIKKGGNMTIEKGTLNNFTPNTTADTPEEGEGAFTPTNVRPLIPVTETEIVNEVSDKPGYVEVITRIPTDVTKVTLTIEIESQKKKPDDIAPLQSSPGNRQLDDPARFSSLLFITCSKKLKSNIGQDEARKAIEIIQNQFKCFLLDITETIISAEDAASLVRKELIKANYKAVVILGGYDVIPSQIISVIDDGLREKINNNPEIANKETDKFIVWSDDIYGDKDGDFLPELPVSRIPDGKNPQLVLSALMAPNATPGKVFGLRNLQRPFADVVFAEQLSKTEKIGISESISPKDIAAGSAAGAVYFMLHGSDDESTTFWGETSGRKIYEAITLQNIPASSPGTIVFSGCCYGALTVYPRASRKKNTQAVVPKLTEDSIALTYLKGGALAFVGCTGSHYSPAVEPYNYYGKPMHDQFWKGINSGKPPALALFEAKKEYAVHMPHDMDDDYGKGIEMKIFRQFTCLGLGW